MQDTKAQRAQSYRLYLYPSLVAKIRDAAARLDIDERRLTAVWLAETVETKRAQMGMTDRLSEAVGGRLGDLLALGLSGTHGEDGEVEQTG